MSPSAESSIAYPPMAHATRERSSEAAMMSPEIVSTQPSAAPSMSLKPDPQEDRQSAQRLRGGCVPCPVRISLFCMIKTESGS
jgi:hypothetical protein